MNAPGSLMKFKSVILLSLRSNSDNLGAKNPSKLFILQLFIVSDLSFNVYKP